MPSIRLPLVLASGLLLFVTAVTPAAAYQTQRERNRIESRSYQVIRVLARELDGRADDILQKARRSARGEDAEQRRWLDNVQHFAQESRAFHERMDGYEETPVDMDKDVAYLEKEATTLGNRLRRNGFFPDTYDDFRQAEDVLGRMQRAARGEDVPVSTAEGAGWDPREHGVPRRSDPGDTAGVPLTGDRLREFRRLADDLDETAVRAHELADRDSMDFRGREQHAEELRHFAGETHGLALRARRSDRLDLDDVAATVNHLLEDARRTLELLQRSDAPQPLVREWEGTLRILEPMSRMVRY
jgi:hypothetical protein